MKKQLLVAGAVTTLGIAGLTGVSAVNAATDSNASSGISGLVTTFAEKFNLNKDEVQAVFDEQRSAMESEREAAMEEKLTQAVTDGEITQEQADKIIAKLAELKSTREVNKDKTAEERRIAMEAERESLRTWAQENDIDMKYLAGGGHGPGRNDGRHENAAISPNSTN